MVRYRYGSGRGSHGVRCMPGGALVRGCAERGLTRESVVRRKKFETFFGDIMPGQRADGLRIVGILPRIFRFGVALLLITSA